MGITLRLRLDQGAEAWLPIAKAHLAAINARNNASVVRSVMNYPGAKITIVRGPVVDQIDIKCGSPYIYGLFIFTKGGTDHVATAQVSPEDSICNLRLDYTRIPRITAPNPFQRMSRAPYIGDGFVLSVLGDGGDNPATPATATAWPVMDKISSEAYQFDATDPARIGRSTSFYPSALITGIESPSYNVFGCGFQNAAKRFKFGWAGLVPSTGAAGTPVMFIGNTKQQVLAQVPYPRAPAAYNHTPFTVCVVGPGHLQALHCVEDSQPTQINPWLADSTDYGDTWTAIDASFLLPYLYANPADGSPGSRDRWTSQLFGISMRSTIQYIGSGKSLLIISNGLKDMLGPGGTPRYCPMIFLGNNGAGYTRLPWPPDQDDAWNVDQNGHILVGGRNVISLFDAPGFWSTQDLNGGQLGFGDGCMCLRVSVGAALSFLVTRDFGATWAFYPRPSGCSIIPTMIKPLTGTDKGRMLVAVPNYVTGVVPFFFTDGTFSAFKSTGGTIKPQGGVQSVTTVVGFNTTFTNFGGTKYPPHIFPAYPTAGFDEPLP